MNRKLEYQLAATTLFESAVKHRTISHSFDPKIIAVKDLYYAGGTVVASSIALAILAIIPLFEPPNPAYVVAASWSIALELWCYVLLMFRAMLKTKLELSSRKSWRNFPGHSFHLVLLIILFVDAIVTGCGWDWNGWNEHRLSRIGRSLLLFEYSNAMGRWVVSVASTVWRSLASWLFLLFHVIFFSILGIMLFYDTDEGREHFHTLDESIVTLIVLLSTCNSPSVIMPGYIDEPLKTIYFVVFILLGTVLTMNLVLAAVYHRHRERLAQEVCLRWIQQQAAISGSYRCMLMLFYHSTDSSTYDQLPRLHASMTSDFIDFLKQSQSNSEKRDSLGAEPVENHPPLPHRYVLELLQNLASRGFQIEVIESEMALLRSCQAGIVKTSEYTGLSYTSFCALVHRMQQADNVGETNPYLLDQVTENTSQDEVASAPTALTPLLLGEQLTVANDMQGDLMVHVDGVVDENEVEHLVNFVKSVHQLKAMSSSRTILNNFCSKIVEAQVTLPTWMSRMVRTERLGVLNGIVNLLLVVNASTTIVAMIVDVDRYMKGEEPSVMFIANYLSTWFFMFEMTFRILHRGWAMFSQNRWNVFELIVVVIAFSGGNAAILIPYIHQSTPEDFQALARALMFVRQVRLLRLLQRISAFRSLTNSIGTLIPIMSVFASIIWVAFYSCALVGVALFSQYRLEDYNGNDFRSFGAALMTLLELMIVNDWNKTMESFVIASGTKVSQLFFIGWYFFAVLVLLNSITTFVVSSFDQSISNRGAKEGSIVEQHSVNGNLPTDPLFWTACSGSNEPVGSWPMEVEEELCRSGLVYLSTTVQNQ